MLAHSDRLVLPMMTAPAARNCAATWASRTALTPASASEPALVLILSPVAMLSFSRTGMPCSGPRTFLAARSRSMAAAMVKASGFSSMTAFRRGPRLSMAAMRARYCDTSACELSFPASICACCSSTPASRMLGDTAVAAAAAAVAVEAAPAAAVVAKPSRTKSLRSMPSPDVINKVHGSISAPGLLVEKCWRKKSCP